MATNGSADPTAVTDPETGAAPATDIKGKGKAVATAEEPVEDTSMVDDEDDEEDDDAEEVRRRARSVLRFSSVADNVLAQEAEAGKSHALLTCAHTPPITSRISLTVAQPRKRTIWRKSTLTT